MDEIFKNSVVTALSTPKTKKYSRKLLKSIVEQIRAV